MPSPSVPTGHQEEGTGHSIPRKMKLVCGSDAHHLPIDFNRLDGVIYMHVLNKGSNSS